MQTPNATKQSDVAVFGAGPSGLACALALSNAKKTVTAVERKNYVGGLAATVSDGAYSTDIGPHRLRSKHPLLFRMLQNRNLGKRSKVKRLTRSYVKGRFYNTSSGIKTLIASAGPLDALSVISGMAVRLLGMALAGKTPGSFEDKVISYFGQSQLSDALISYAEKMWGVNAGEILPDWSHTAGRHLPPSENKRQTEKYFFCHEKGSGHIYEEVKDAVFNEGGELLLSSYPIKIYHDNFKITHAIVMRGGREETVNANWFVNTTPIARFIELFSPAPPLEVIYACKAVRSRSHISVFFTLDKPSVMKDQWVYFPGKEVPFLRISEPKNFSSLMAPKQKTSLLVEYFCFDNDAMWTMPRKDIFALTVKHLSAMKFINPEEVTGMRLFKERDAYPLAEKKALGAVKTVLAYAAKFNNLELAGRGGLFAYNDQSSAINSGIEAADKILAKIKAS